MHQCYCFIVFFMLFFLMSCHDGHEPIEADKVKVQLKYVHQAQFAGMYVALEKGLYHQENLDVEFIEGGRDRDSVTPVVSGEAHFGIAASDILLLKRYEGDPIVAIAAVYRKCAAAFFSKKESGIIRPADMVGKRIAVVSENAKEYEIQLRAMVKTLGLDITTMTLLPLDQQYEGFLGGDVDVTGAYITGGAMRMSAQGVELNTIWPGDYGIRFYSDTLFVNESLIQTNPDMILRFLRATLKGWEIAIGDQTTAVEMTMKYARIKERELQTMMMAEQYPLIHTGESHIGWMSHDVWKGMSDILYQEGIIADEMAHLDRMYTMEFLHAIYGEE